MAVERKTFLWIGNDRAYRTEQESIGITAGSSHPTYSTHPYGSTGIEGWNDFFGQYWNVGGGGIEIPGSTGHKRALDVFWNNKDNWAEKVSGISGGDGITPGGVYEGSYYIKASRIPHRGDHVVFEYVTGTTGNGLMRGYVGETEGFSGAASYGKPFNAPMSPCLFGGYSRTNDGLSGEGSIWANAETSGASASNRRGPLSSVKVFPSYFHHKYGVMGDSQYTGWAGDGSNLMRDSGYPYWGGRVITSGVGGPSGGSFGNVAWTVGNTGINLRALDVQINSPYRMNNASLDSTVPGTVTNAAKYGGQTISLQGGDESPFTICRLGYSDNIINLNVGCRMFIQHGGSVNNLSVSDLYMPFATDAERRELASSKGAPEEPYGEDKGGMVNIVALANSTITNTLRCDPCWYSGIIDNDSGGGIGNPDIIWGPYYAYGTFTPRVTAAGTVTCYPQQIAGKDLFVSDIEAGNGSDGWDGVGWPAKFASFELLGPSENKRFSATTIDMKEFNPRWDVVTSEGTKTVDFARRGFNNTMSVGAGCTVTNLNVDAGFFKIGESHSGGDTFDASDEVSDIVILNGYAEEKALVSGENPRVPSFNSFYIGKGGVSETGNNFQIRSKDAEFDFSSGVYLRSGPATTGFTGAGYKFVQAPRATKRK